MHVLISKGYSRLLRETMLKQLVLTPFSEFPSVRLKNRLYQKLSDSLTLKINFSIWCPLNLLALNPLIGRQMLNVLRFHKECFYMYCVVFWAIESSMGKIYQYMMLGS